jgi:hypothetical protein
MKAVADWEVVPSTPAQIEAVAKECRKMVSRRALLAAGVAVVPIPGVDWATNVGVLLKVLPDINRRFGLSAEQVERLAPDRKLVVFKAITAGGTMLVGRLVTREVVMSMLRMGRGVAQPGSASGLGPEGRRFESFRPDHVFLSARLRCDHAPAARPSFDHTLRCPGANAPLQ